MRKHDHDRALVLAALRVCSSACIVTGKVRWLFTIVAAGVFLLLTGITHAEVIIYKAPFKCARDASLVGDIPKKGSGFIIFDASAGKLALITVNPLKKRFVVNVSPQAGFGFATPNLLGAKTATVIAKEGGETVSDPESFLQLFYYFRGTNKSLTVQSQPTKQIATAPRLLTGQIFGTNKNAGTSGFFEFRFVSAFHGPRTVAANDAGKTIEQVYDDLIAEYLAKGFVEAS